MRVARAEAVRQLRRLGWQLDGDEAPGRPLRVVRRHSARDGAAQSAPATMAWHMSSDAQPHTLTEALRAEQLHRVEVVLADAEGQADPGA